MPNVSPSRGLLGVYPPLSLCPQVFTYCFTHIILYTYKYLTPVDLQLTNSVISKCSCVAALQRQTLQNKLAKFAVAAVKEAFWSHTTIEPRTICSRGSEITLYWSVFNAMSLFESDQRFFWGSSLLTSHLASANSSAQIESLTSYMTGYRTVL